MSGTPDLDRRITAWLDDRAMSRAPDDLLEETLDRTSRLRRRPAWRIPERWIPMPITLRLAVVPRAAIYLLLLALLVALVAAGGLVAGSLHRAAVSLPPPTGPARNGLIAYGIKGDIWLMNQRGDQRTQLTFGPELDYPGVWSPDGQWLAYWSVGYAGDPEDSLAVQAATQAGTSSVKAIRADGTDDRTLASGANWPADCGTDLSWSPDSAAVAYGYLDPAGPAVPKVAVAQLAGGAPRLVADHAFTPSWSPDGRTIAWADFAYYQKPDGSRAVGQGISLTSIAEDAAEDAGYQPLTYTPGSGCAFNEPQWSNDSSQIVFYAGSDGSHEIWVAAADGSGEQQISPGLADEYWPRWSPDNTRIAYDHVVLPGSNAPQFVLTDPDGGNQVMLDHPPLSARYPTWSPDGTLLLGMTMNQTSANASLMLVDVTGAKPPVTIATGHLWGDPAWQRLAP